MMIIDGLKNFVAELGTGRDKAASTHYAPTNASPEQLFNAYRYNWLPRKVVDIPALDATRKWRNWQAEADQINDIESEERRLGLQIKVLEALKKDRLYGGAAIYISVAGNTDTSLPLDPATVAAGGIDHLTVLSRYELNVHEWDRNPISANYGKPAMYMVANSTQQIRIHPSRVAVFVSNPIQSMANTEDEWGDSVLTPALDACLSADSTLANIGSLVYEAKVDVLGIPNLGTIMQDDNERASLVNRVRLAAQLKGNNGMLVRDVLEEYESKSFAFANLDNIGNLMLTAASGAADIPMTRLLGQSPGGLDSSGESDLRNYYDRVQSIQNLQVTPSLAILDECLINSALGERPEKVYYTWAPLWQVTEKERAENGKQVADTITAIANSRLIPEDALSRAAANTLTELGILPGLEAAIEELGGFEEQEV